MTFTVTYRAKDGALREERVEAASRAECVTVCRRRGIAPTGIREGGKNRQDGGSPSQRRLTGNAAILAAVVLAAIAGGAWWWFGGRGATALLAKAPAKPKVEKPKAEKPKASPHATKPAATPAPSAETPAKEMYLGQEVVSRTSVTNADGSVRETVRTADGKLHGITHPAPGSEPIFKNAADQAIAMALSVSDTVSSAPLPGMGGNLDEEFVKAIQTPIEINDGDSEAVKGLKKAVMETREEIKKLMDKGQSFSQVLNEHVRLARENYDLRVEAFKELKSLVEAGDADAAEKYLSTVNKTLEQMGITKLDMPLTAEQKAAQREAIRRERERILKEKSK